jgi:hypothetical protein
MEIDLVEAPEIRREMIAAAADQARVQRRLFTPRHLRLAIGMLAEGLRTYLGIDRNPAEKEVLQFVVFELGWPQARPLFEDHDCEPGLRQFARQHSAGGARPDHGEIHGVIGFESASGQECFSVG